MASIGSSYSTLTYINANTYISHTRFQIPATLAAASLLLPLVIIIYNSNIQYLAHITHTFIKLFVVKRSRHPWREFSISYTLNKATQIIGLNEPIPFWIYLLSQSWIFFILIFQNGFLHLRDFILTILLRSINTKE